VKFFIDNLLLFALAIVSGGLLLWPALRRGGASSVTPQVATQWINQRNAIVVDVRDEKAFAAGSVTGARNLPLATLEGRLADLARFKARPIVVVCDSGQQSSRALATFKAQGFEEAVHLAGGVQAWKSAGLPLVTVTRETPRAAATPRPPRNRNKGRNNPTPALAPAVPPDARTPANDALADPPPTPDPLAPAPSDRIKEAT